MASVITARMQSEMVAVLTGELAPFLVSMQPGLSLPASVLGEQWREGEQDPFDYNAARDGYVVNLEQMEVVRRIFYMAGVEKTTMYAIKREFERRGLRTPSGKADWDPNFIRGFLLSPSSALP